MRERLRDLSCQEIGLIGAVLVGWFFLGAEQAVGVALCLFVGFGVNALLNVHPSHVMSSNVDTVA